MVCGPDGLWRVPYGVHVRSAWQSCWLGKPWSSLPCPRAGGMAALSATGGRKGIQGVNKDGREIEGRCDTAPHGPNLEVGPCNVFSGLHLTP